MLDQWQAAHPTLMHRLLFHTFLLLQQSRTPRRFTTIGILSIDHRALEDLDRACICRSEQRTGSHLKLRLLLHAKPAPSSDKLPQRQGNGSPASSAKGQAVSLPSSSDSHKPPLFTANRVGVYRGATSPTTSPLSLVTLCSSLEERSCCIAAAASADDDDVV